MDSVTASASAAAEERSGVEWVEALLLSSTLLEEAEML